MSFRSVRAVPSNAGAMTGILSDLKENVEVLTGQRGATTGTPTVVTGVLSNALTAWTDNVYYSQSYTSFANAIASIGSSNGTLIINQSLIVGANITVPSNIRLFFIGTGSLHISLGVTVTISGSLSVDCMRQIFYGPGAVSFSSAATVYPEWWGITGSSDQVAINAAIASLPKSTAQGGSVNLMAKQYVTDGVITMMSNITLEGCGERATIIQNNGTTNTINMRGADVSASYLSRGMIKKMRIKGTASSGHGVYLEDFEHCKLSEVSIYNHGGDGVRATKDSSTRADQLTIEFSRITNNLGWGIYQPSFGHQFALRDTIVNSNGEGSDIGTASGEGNAKLYCSGIDISNSQFSGITGVVSVILTGSGASLSAVKFEGDASVASAATFLKLGETAGNTMYGAHLNGCIFAGGAVGAATTLLDIENGVGTVLNGGIFDANSDYDVVAIDVGADSVKTTIVNPRLYGNPGSGGWTDYIFSDPGEVNYIIGNPPAFRAAAGGSQQATIGSTDLVTWTEEVDRGGNFASNVFTAPVAGLYQANVSTRLTGVDNTSSVLLIAIQGGSKYAKSVIDPRMLSATGVISLNVSDLFALSAGDSLQVYITQTGGSSPVTVHSDSVFSGYLVRIP